MSVQDHLDSLKSQRQYSNPSPTNVSNMNDHMPVVQQQVWVRVDNTWQPCRVMKLLSNDTASVRLTTDKHRTADITVCLSDLLLTNPASMPMVADLCDLPAIHLHEPAVVEVLSRRFASNILYTSLGPFIIFINNYNNNANDNGSESRCNTNTIAEHALKQLFKNKRRQIICFQGEKHSGKSYNLRQVSDYYLRNTKQDSLYSKVFSTMIQSLFTILTSFGCVRQSSKLCYVLHYYFDKHSCVTSAEVVLLHLDRTIVSRRYSEDPYMDDVTDDSIRNYNIFYELIQGSWESERKSLNNFSPDFDGYVLLKSSKRPANDDFYRNTSTDAFDYITGYRNLRNALSYLNFTDADQHNIVKIILAILYLGNIQFEQVGNRDVKIQNMNVLVLVGNLLGIDDLMLATSLLKKNDNLKMTLIECEQCCRILIETLYEHLVQDIVRRCHNVLRSQSSYLHCFNSSDNFIALIDHSGFARNSTNQLSSLLANYIDERWRFMSLSSLHQNHVQNGGSDDQISKYLSVLQQNRVILSQQSKVSASSSSSHSLSNPFFESQNVITMIEGKGALLETLEEESIRARGSDVVFVSKLGTRMKDLNKKFNNTNNSSFGGILSDGGTIFRLNHCGPTPTTYQAKDIVRQNCIVVSLKTVACLKSSTNAIVLDMFGYSGNCAVHASCSTKKNESGYIRRLNLNDDESVNYIAPPTSSCWSSVLRHNLSSYHHALLNVEKPNPNHKSSYGIDYHLMFCLNSNDGYMTSSIDADSVVRQIKFLQIILLLNNKSLLLDSTASTAIGFDYDNSKALLDSRSTYESKCASLLSRLILNTKTGTNNINDKNRLLEELHLAEMNMMVTRLQTAYRRFVQRLKYKVMAKHFCSLLLPLRQFVLLRKQRMLEHFNEMQSNIDFAVASKNKLLSQYAIMKNNRSKQTMAHSKKEDNLDLSLSNYCNSNSSPGNSNNNTQVIKISPDPKPKMSSHISKSETDGPIRLAFHLMDSEPLSRHLPPVPHQSVSLLPPPPPVGYVLRGLGSSSTVTKRTSSVSTTSSISSTLPPPPLSSHVYISGKKGVHMYPFTSQSPRGSLGQQYGGKMKTKYDGDDHHYNDSSNDDSDASSVSSEETVLSDGDCDA